MGEQTVNLTTLMETLLSRFDEEKLLGDKRTEAQMAFNNEVSHELQSLTKKNGLTQADVDDVRKVASSSTSFASSPASQIDDPSSVGVRTPAAARAAPRRSALRIPQVIVGIGPAARLVNDGPPLLASPDESFPPSTRGYPSTPCDEFPVHPPKHHFPRFDGEVPSIWLDRCLAYFELYHVPQHNWVPSAALYVEGHAALWLRAFRQTHEELTWEMFCHALVEEFGPEESDYLMHKLLLLQQTGSVMEHRQQFEVYMYNLLALDSTLSPNFCVTQFLLGLKDELCTAVRLQAPTSMTRTSVFAHIQEEEAEHQRPRTRQFPPTRAPQLPSTSLAFGRPYTAAAVAPSPVPAARPAPPPCWECALEENKICLLAYSISS